MTTNLAIFVEGRTDMKFVVDLIHHLTDSPKRKIKTRGSEFEDVLIIDRESSGAQVKLKLKVIYMGGVDNLKNMKVKMAKFRDESERESNEAKILVILDADDKADDRRKEVEELRAKLGFDDYFLMPNNKSAGTIETLLEAIAVDERRHIFECFNTFEECLRKQKKGYITPLSKSRVFAYCETLPGGSVWASDRDYRNPEHWNLDSPELSPLKEFLRKYLL